jgi:tetratricopeptide (TPR) repeat protein
MSGYKVARLDEIEELTDGREPWRPVRHHLGIAAFGVNAWTGAAAGERIINEHTEDDSGGHDELYIVLSGRARFEFDGEQVDAPVGTFVHVERGVRRTAFAEEAGTTIVVVGAEPGVAYTPSGWEVWAPLQPLYADGRYEEAAEQGRALIEAHPHYASVFYNVACCESLAGQTQDAVAHLERAIELSPQFRDYARGDSDFDPIRSESAFGELVAES